MLFQTHIAIVGGGAVGVSTAHHLIEALAKCQLQKPIRITIFERSSLVGPGLAYCADEPTNLLNTRAESLSVIYGKNDDFLQWLNSNRERWAPGYPGLDLSPKAFLPRSLFGLYLQAAHQRNVAKAADAGMILETLHEEVVDIERSNNLLILRTDKGALIKADFVHLCCGNLPSIAFPEFASIPQYINTPYPTRDLVQKIHPSRDVLIAGSRLSAIDTTIALLQHGHRGKIRLVSRGGRLPSVRGNQKSIILRHLTTEGIAQMAVERDGLRLDDISSLILKELGDRTEGLPSFADMPPSEYLAREIAASQTQDRPWQAVLYALNAVIDQIWRALRDSDKKDFLRKFKSDYIAHRVSIPLENAMRIAKAIDAGSVTVDAGLSALHYDKRQGGFIAKLRGKEGETTLLHGDFLVNATGSGDDIALEQSPLIRNLFNHGLLKKHHFGGIDVEFHTGRARNNHGDFQRDIAFVGSLTSGVYFFTTALDINVRHAMLSAQYTANAIAQMDSSALIALNDIAAQHRKYINECDPHNRRVKG